MNEPQESEFAAGTYGRTQSGQPRRLTPKERAQAQRSAAIRRTTVADAAASRRRP